MIGPIVRHADTGDGRRGRGCRDRTDRRDRLQRYVQCHGWRCRSARGRRRFRCVLVRLAAIARRHRRCYNRQCDRCFEHWNCRHRKIDAGIAERGDRVLKRGTRKRAVVMQRGVFAPRRDSRQMRQLRIRCQRDKDGVEIRRRCVRRRMRRNTCALRCEKHGGNLSHEIVRDFPHAFVASIGPDFPRAISFGIVPALRGARLFRQGTFCHARQTLPCRMRRRTWACWICGKKSACEMA